jgi:phosphoglycerate dehydrogenase-like enzyme
MASNLTIWCNARLPQIAEAELVKELASYRLMMSQERTGNLAAGAADPKLAEADIAFGQPNVQQIMDLKNLRWVHLSSAGYARYDRPDLRAEFKKRGAILTNSSAVYDEPCAEHVLAMILAEARQLPKAMANQTGPRGWPAGPLREQSRLLGGQTVLILGLGAIARRLIELLAPLKMHVMAIRQSVRGDETIRTYPPTEMDRILPQADHVINVLPSGSSTDRLMDMRRFALMKPTAVFYNVGRGSTVDQTALAEALAAHRLSAAYLDVTEPEPLPKDHPLWTAPNCHITPHTAGGCSTEFHRGVRHFLDNLSRFETSTPLRDRIV